MYGPVGLCLSYGHRGFAATRGSATEAVRRAPGLCRPRGFH